MSTAPLQTFGLSASEITSFSLRRPTNQSVTSKLLCEKAENIYKKTQTLMSLLNQPARSVTACSNLLLSAQYLFSAPGSIGCFAALISLASSISELRRLTTPEKATVERFLVELSGDLQTIEAIAQIQKEHHGHIGENLEIIDDNVEALNLKLLDLDKLNTAQLEKIKKKKTVALVLRAQADAAYQRAQAFFIQAQKDARHAMRIFHKSENLHQIIQEFAQNETPDIQRICHISIKAFKSIKNGCLRQSESDKNYQSGKQALEEAHKLREEVVQIVTQILLETEFSIQSNIEKTKTARENAEQIKKANKSSQKALNKAVADHQHMMNIMESMGKKLAEADQLAQSKYGFSELISGLVTTAFLTHLTTGFFAVSGGLATVGALHCSQYISKTIVCAYRYFSHLPMLELPHVPTGMDIYVEFDKKSSGFWGNYVMGRSSKTVGNYIINLGNDQNPDLFVMRFDLNDPHKVSRVQLLQLIEEMNRRLRENRIDKEQYLNIFESLTESHHIYGTDSSPDDHSIQILPDGDDFLAIIRHLRANMRS